MTSPIREYSMIRTRIESDPYNPVLVEDLINGVNDWRSVQDIVRLTFKALSDVVKSQGSSLKELESQFPGKASKSEISQVLNMKSVYSELSRSVSDLKIALEGKMNVDDVYSLVEEKVSRNDLQHLLGTKASYEELRDSLSEKADLREVQSELRALRAIIEEMNEENYRKFQQCASKRELQQVQALAETKANKDEMLEALEEKANKQSVANALHRKSNKTDVESLLSTKVETQEYSKLYETVQEIHSQFLLKFEKIESSRKNEKNETESSFAHLQAYSKENETKFLAYFSKLENQTTALKAKLEEFQNITNSLMSKKTEVRDFEKLFQTVNRKADNDHVKEIVNNLQAELKDQLQTLRFESLNAQDLLNSRCEKLDFSIRSAQTDLIKAQDSIKIVSESTKINLEEGVKSVHLYTGSKLEEVKALRLDIEKLYRSLEDIRQRNVEKNEFWKNLENKVDGRDLKEFIDKHSREISRQIQLSSDELKDFVMRKEKELSMMIDKKPGMHEVNSLILESVVSRKKHIEDSYNEERTVKTFRNDSVTDSLQKDLSRIRLELDDRISSFITEQNSLNEMLCAENCVARWLWRSGDLKNGFSVPWEFESVNTCPENFIWEVGATSVTAVASGLYEIAFAIFSRKKPNIEVLVNGQPILIEFNCAGKNWGRHSDGNIVAASTIDFITLPNRARLSMTYSGESGAEGFIGLRKL